MLWRKAQLADPRPQLGHSSFLGLLCRSPDHKNMLLVEANLSFSVRSTKAVPSTRLKPQGDLIGGAIPF